MKCEETENARCLYLALTHDNVRRISWDTIHRLDRSYDLGITFNEAFLRARFPTGSLIEYCGIGAGASGEVADRFRGASEGFDMVVIDEASKFRPAVLDYLIEAVIEPALMDKGGALIMTGTPTTNASGVFYKATSDGIPGWKQFFWTAEQNPHMAAQWAAAVAKKRAENPRIDENAEFRREYFGEWVLDSSDLVYQIDEALNVVDIAPQVDSGHWAGFAIGCDIGWQDSTAMSVVGWQRGKSDLWVLESHKAKRLLPDKIAERLRELQSRYPNAPIIIDTGHASKAQTESMGGGLGQHTVAQELGYRYGIGTIPTEKADKPTWIKTFNSDLVAGRVHVVRGKNADLLAEMRQLAWQQVAMSGRTDSGETQSTSKEQPGMPNDCCDATLYAYRFAWHYLEKPPEFAVQSEEEKMFERNVVKRRDARWR